MDFADKGVNPIVGQNLISVAYKQVWHLQGSKKFGWLGALRIEPTPHIDKWDETSGGTDAGV